MYKLFATNGTGNHVATGVALRCPLCRQNGIFAPLFPQDLGWSQREDPRVVAFNAGVRICPNPQCRAVVYAVFRAGALLVSYPPELLDFDASNIPPRVASCMEEAIKCHASESYTAAAMMLRRTLELLCDDRGTKGANLFERIAKLGEHATLPKELLEAAHELRLLGNDAAHVEAKEYETIGKEEVEAAVDLTKELLKAVYQYSVILGRLRSLKKPAGS